MHILLKILLWYLFVINLLGFILCGQDKRKAKKRRWRIPEKTLFAVSGLGGCFGFLLGMLTFHHKTKHLAFQILIPLFCVLWTAAAVAAVIYL